MQAFARNIVAISIGRNRSDIWALSHTTVSAIVGVVRTRTELDTDTTCKC